jgi:hypothetical protein
LGLLCLTLLSAALPAGAEELTREAFVSRAESICRTNVDANKRIFKGAKGEVKAGELKKASRHFTRAGAAFARTIKQLEALPRPSADEAKLVKWFGDLGVVKGFVWQIGAALAGERRHRAESISVKLNSSSTRANNQILGFGFDYCRLDSTRFG